MLPRSVSNWTVYCSNCEPVRTKAVTPWVARLTGIRNEDLEGAPTFSDIVEDLFSLLEGHVFVAHDIRFDLPFLRWEFARRGLARPAVTGLCTLQLSRQFWPDLASRSLPDLADHFGIKHDNPHRAAHDAAATAGVLLEALDAALTLGMNDLGDLFSAEAFLNTRRKDREDLAARSAES